MHHFQNDNDREKKSTWKSASCPSVYVLKVLPIATQQPDVSAHTKYDIQLTKRLLLKRD